MIQLSARDAVGGALTDRTPACLPLASTVRMHRFVGRLGCLLLIMSPLLLPQTAHAQIAEQFDLKRPGDREFVLDSANMISDDEEQSIRQLADQLLTDKAAPIVVVTIESMEKHGGAGLRIETFARLLFDQWGIGPEKAGDTLWNYGMLLLVSKQDRKARIELGAGWKRDKDVVAQQIMDGLIIPRFKAGDFPGGIAAGVEGLDKMARELQLPRRPRPASHYIVGVIVCGLLVFTIWSLIRRGSSGWAWLMWAAVFGVVGAILYQMATNRSSGGGGGFSGGSFGGGFSGGGGASGSW
ncbi:MAG: TPM domain-containing protein [Planctomycetaceae bacterium]|jgi:uncharacterized protein